MILVQAQQYFWRAISKMIDKTVVKSAKARTRIDSYIFDAQIPQQVSRDVTAPLFVFKPPIIDGTFNFVQRG